MDNLLNYSISNNPKETFLRWYDEAMKCEQNAQAMSVSTYDSELARPTNRYLLFKGFQGENIIFYTNYLSPKSKNLDHNSEVALAFYWHNSKKQVRLQGRATKMSLEESRQYFHSRDRDSQIASFISHQSSEISDKEALVKLFNETKKKYEGMEIPHPQNWGGFLVKPYEYEFFLYGENRLNDRFLFIENKGNWEISRLQP